MYRLLTMLGRSHKKLWIDNEHIRRVDSYTLSNLLEKIRPTSQEVSEVIHEGEIELANITCNHTAVPTCTTTDLYGFPCKLSRRIITLHSNVTVLLEWGSRPESSDRR